MGRGVLLFLGLCGSLWVSAGWTMAPEKRATMLQLHTQTCTVGHGQTRGPIQGQRPFLNAQEKSVGVYL